VKQCSKKSVGVELLEKAEVEGHSSENAQNMITNETPPPQYQASDDTIQESLRIVNEEALQLSEFLLQEEKLIRELCVILKQVLKQLNMSITIPANVLPQQEKIQRIILNDEAHLILINDKNEVKSKALEDYPPEVIYNIASFIIPELSKSLTFYRKKISSRISLFDRINQELRNLRNTLVNRPKKLDGNTNQINNGVKTALSPKQKDSSKG